MERLMLALCTIQRLRNLDWSLTSPPHICAKPRADPNMMPFSNQKYLNLETYRKDGSPVRTPVWFVEESGLLHAYTDRTAGKVKRIRRNPNVRAAPCDFGGNLKGDWLDGEAEILEDSETPRIMRLFKKKYGLTISLLRSYDALYRFLTRNKDEIVIIAIQIKPQ